MADWIQLASAISDTVESWRYAPGPDEPMPGDGWMQRRRTMAIIILAATFFGGAFASWLRRRSRR